MYAGRVAREHAEDPIDVAETAYDLAGDDRAWLARVLAAAAPSMDRGLGVFACFFELTETEEVHFRDPVYRGTDSAVGVAFQPLRERLEPSLVRRLFVYGPAVASLLDLLGWGYLSKDEVELGRSALKQAGCRDLLSVRVYDELHRQGLLLVAPLGRKKRAAAPFVTRWERLSGQLAAGLRLRRMFDSSEASGADVALREAAAAVEAETGRMRREPPERAIALWRGLVSGKWSLVDHFDEAGRRYIIARRNDPQVRDPRALTERERQVALQLSRGLGNKQIAFALDLSVNTVAHHVRRVQRKLGFESRVELVDFLGQLRVHLIDHALS
jgi:DNA-binding CsgD family transcriptional regulator